MRKRLEITRLCLAFMVACTIAGRAIQISVDVGPFSVDFYGSGEAVGGYAGDRDWVDAEITAMTSAINQWDQGILNTAGRDIVLAVVWDELGGALGISTNYLVSGTGLGPAPTATAPELVWRDGWTGAVNGSSFDTLIAYNSTTTWHFTEVDPPSTSYDFRSVACHEIGHSLGIASRYDSGTDTFGSLTAWDQNLIDGSGVKPVSGGDTSFNEVDNPVYWDGDTAAALYGGNIPIYAPDPYASGSSLTHLDESTFPTGSGYLMTPSLTNGEVVREPSSLEWAMMTDMGWFITPEPNTLVLLLGMTVLSLLRRQRSTR